MSISLFHPPAFHLENGWIQPARHCPSPNYNQRPADTPINLLVIHNISLPAGEFGNANIDLLFTNQLDSKAHPSFDSLEGLQVSSHLLIRRDGELVQYVALEQRAWHAGLSSFQGHQGCNDFSIGIELEGTDDLPYSEAQYPVLIAVTQCLQTHYPHLQHICGHEHIAPTRKTDPGPAFDWQRFYAGVTQNSSKNSNGS
ncbi:1,6-anhydro-N-acetylmuramyl-L-alanine amidase AmpD [Candidatus Venteria ishoeyi]|uniref:1,6-anhydro-N-acetylmuramyl-L-alanine amidase AmpD n=1 Tax=Candidatus Venteria ishoeyi TaxID=1899563 RepID=UPI0025A4D685|nr:1,6-anhydro-N-acetylmuramyl-L-alanine amidase AmpD [Candidatus Venteria ishoeyi]MDM8548045.1 1,6-anhydro-N-acetylmuramyl-L-alanine amidase AmpD [Candidatus Venteria ishoeyi]